MKVQDFFKLPYHRVFRQVIEDGETFYYARIAEFDGCMTHGDTIEEASRNLDEAMELWIESKLDGGWEVPRPQSDDVFVVRLPRSLHQKLAERAGSECVSLDEYATYKLSAVV